MTQRVALTLCAFLVGCSSDLECPDGTTQQRSAATGETQRWCARPDGTRHGPYELHTKTHSLTGRYVDGLRHGSWRYHDVRSGFVATYVLDHGTGLVIEWYPGLRKKSEQEFRRGVSEGVRTDYAPDGKIRRVSFFRDGVPAGTWYEWGADGKETSVRQRDF